MTVLVLVRVDRSHWREGIGRSLLEQGLKSLRQRGVRKEQLGGGGPAYFWPGVPTNLPEAWSFFSSCGWREQERSFDLIGDLEEYTSLPVVYQRIRMPEVVILGSSCIVVPQEGRWEVLTGPGTAELGPLGVAEPYRENGIGLAIAARVTERMQTRGLRKGFIGWTWLVDWYGRLGYRVFQEYIMSWKDL